MSQFEAIHLFVASASIWPSDQCLKNTVTAGGLLQVCKHAPASNK